MDNFSSQQSKKRTSDRQFWLFGMRIVGDFGATIAVPVVAFAIAGKWLDRKFGTAPWLLIAGFAAAAVISGFTIWRKAKRLGAEYQKMINADSHFTEETSRITDKPQN